MVGKSINKLNRTTFTTVKRKEKRKKNKMLFLQKSMKKRRRQKQKEFSLVYDISSSFSTMSVHLWKARFKDIDLVLKSFLPLPNALLKNIFRDSKQV